MAQPRKKTKRSVPGEAQRAKTGVAVPTYGAIAQLGERVLCKHEVVGSIPSGSTTLRLEATRGAATQEKIRSVPGEARKSGDGLPIVTRNQIVRETSLRTH